MGLKLNVKWGSPVQSPYHLTTSSYCPSSFSSRSKETSYDSARVTFAFVISCQSEASYNGPLKAHRCPTAPQTSENDYSEMEDIKMNIGKRSHDGLNNTLDDNITMPMGDDKLTFLASLQASRASQFGLLLQNLDMLESTFADSDVLIGELQKNDTADVHSGKIVIPSRKKEERKSRRKRASEKVSGLAFPSKGTQKDQKKSALSSVKRLSNSRSRRLKVAKNEAEMARGVKLVEYLEGIRTVLEEETGQVASLRRWAEAAGVEEKVLKQHLHFGWYCKDELLKSSHSLVVYLARNYRGIGVAFEDLIQAGNFGVLQGAVRFDHTRGYKFSTYVQYWIRKSISTLVAQHARGIRIPFTLNKAINQIHKARKALSTSQGKYPGDDEIAKFTGLSLAKITLASKCLRVVGSIDQKVGDFSVKFMELTADKSIKSPEEAVMRQHMIKEIHGLLNGLGLRERQVLILRFGLGDHQRRSLEEIGRRFCVSKEWIRKIERTALTKLRDEETCRNLRHYLHL
ncbi:hypothetical protein CsSME_00049335 [Camellia sinensis var. sinensis]